MREPRKIWKWEAGVKFSPTYLESGFLPLHTLALIKLRCFLQPTWVRWHTCHIVLAVGRCSRVLSGGTWGVCFSRMDPRCFSLFTSFLPRLYLCRDVRWTSEEWKWWYRASRRETWMPPEIEVNPMISGGKVFLHLKEGMVEENSTAFRLVNWVLSSLHVGQLDEDGVEGAGDHHQDWHDKKHCVVPHLIRCWKKSYVIIIHLHKSPENNQNCDLHSQGWVCRHFCLYLTSLAPTISFVHKMTCLCFPSQTQIKWSCILICVPLSHLCKVANILELSFSHITKSRVGKREFGKVI